jgi:hypothetical protein
MKNYEKILIVLLFGSLWGALELFGRDIFRAIGAPDKSVLLFGLGIIILYASKRLLNIPGSVVIMAVIACLFKTASSHFFACQLAAVLINGIVFDAAYTLFQRRLNASPVFRTIAVPVIVYVSYTAFAFVTTYLLREPSWATEGWPAIQTYLTSDALKATLISMVTIHVGYHLGGLMQPAALLQRLRLPAVAFRVASIVLVAAIWIAGQWFANV